MHPNIRDSKYIKQQLKSAMGRSTITDGDLCTSLTVIGQTSRTNVKISKDLGDLNNSIKHGICRVFYLATAEHTNYSSEHERFTKRGNILGHKTSVYKKCKRIEII